MQGLATGLRKNFSKVGICRFDCHFSYQALLECLCSSAQKTSKIFTATARNTNEQNETSQLLLGDPDPEQADFGSGKIHRRAVL